MSENMSYRHCMRPNRSPFAFMHSYAGSPARPVRAQKKPAWRGRGKVYRMIKRFRFLRMCAPAPHNLPYIPTQNKSLHHAPHPAVVPVPYSHSHRRASPLQSPFARHRQLFGWLVVIDHRCYSGGGLGFSPDGFR